MRENKIKLLLGNNASSTGPTNNSGGGCWLAALACAMGCFGSAQHGGTAEGKAAGGGGSDDSKSQKRRSDAITRQLQKDKQVTFNYKLATLIIS